MWKPLHVVNILIWAKLAVADDCSHLSGYSSYVDSCFKLYAISRSWSNAESMCVADGGHLASIHNNEEKNFIEGLIVATSSDLWIGLKGSPTTMTWTDGTNLDYKNWFMDAEYSYDIEPNGSGDCVRMKQSYGYEWADNQCSTKYHFLCRLVTDTTTTATTTTSATTAPTTNPTLSMLSTKQHSAQNQVCFTKIPNGVSMDPTISPSTVHIIRSTLECAYRCHKDAECVHFIMREEAGKYLCETYTSLAQCKTAAPLIGNYEKNDC